MAKLTDVLIKPECRETHGYMEAFDLAVEHLRKAYKLVATETNRDRIFRLELNIEPKE